MINFFLHNFVVAQKLLKDEVDKSYNKMMTSPHENVAAIDDMRIRGTVDAATKYCVEALFLKTTYRTTIQELFLILGDYHINPYTWQQVHVLLERLKSEIDWEIRSEYFFHYQRDVAEMLRTLATDWKEILLSFPSMRREIEAGLDCFAFNDYPGAIFHMLRIAETGLRAIARERGIRSVRNNKPIKYAMWGEVIGALQTAISNLATSRGRTSPLTPKRRENRELAVEFYSTIMGDMQALLPLRDRTFHLRDQYDKGEARTAMNRTKEMMTVISTKISETDQRRIRWGL